MYGGPPCKRDDQVPRHRKPCRRTVGRPVHTPSQPLPSVRGGLWERRGAWGRLANRARGGVAQVTPGAALALLTAQTDNSSSRSEVRPCVWCVDDKITGNINSLKPVPQRRLRWCYACGTSLLELCYAGVVKLTTLLPLSSGGRSPSRWPSWRCRDRDKPRASPRAHYIC